VASRVTERVDDLLARAGVVGAKATAVKAAAVLAAIGISVAITRVGRAPAVEFSSTPDVSQEYVSNESTPAAEVGVVVHVAGAVRQPGVYELHAGARVDDAIRSAGGMLGSAVGSALNLARVLVDGEQVYVPTQDEIASGAIESASAPGGSSGASGSLVNLNTATAADLEALPGIGPSTAQKIVDDRTANGPFTSVDDLVRISGIGTAKVESLRDLVTVK